MKILRETVEQRMARFEQVCRGAGIKLTPQRLEIFREVAQSEDHPDADMVHTGVRKRLSMVSLDTVYRTLWLLNDLDLINTLGPPRERVRFDANLEQHHHFVCTRCGLTRDFYSEELNQLSIPSSIEELGTIETTHLEIRGVCVICEKKHPNGEPRRAPKAKAST